MVVQAVKTDEYVDGGYLSTILGSTAAGSGAGLAAKYLLPLNKEEKEVLASKMKTLTQDVFEGQKKLLNQEKSKIKHLRPAIQFVVLGGVIGFFAGLIRNMFKP